jgi:hypothetical protein
MKAFLVRYPEKEPFLLDGGLNYIKPDVPSSFKLSQLKISPKKHDMILFYHTFKSEDGALQDTIFMYFQVDKTEKDDIFPAELLTFDNQRAGMGILNYSKKRVLTRYGSVSNHWSLPEFFKCLDITFKGKRLTPFFRENGGVRYFENTTAWLEISAIPSRSSGEYFENALAEWVSSMCEDIRGVATRHFNSSKKGDVGVGKTGFVKYSYCPDSRGRFYCRLNHTVGKRNMKICLGCPMYQKKKGRHICEWSLPLYNATPYIPLTLPDAYAYFDVLLEKGLVMDYRD